MKGNISKRGKNSWRLKFDLGVNPLTGKRDTQYVTFRGSKKEAQAELTKLLNERNEGDYLEPSKITLAEYLKDWLEVQKLRVKPTTWDGWNWISNKYICPNIGKVPLTSLSALHLEKYYRDMMEKGRTQGDGGLSAQTVLHHHRLIFQSLKRGVKKGLIRKNVAADAEAPRPERKEISYLSDEETISLLKFAKGGEMYLPILLAVSTGLRRGELLGVRWKDINLETAVLTVNQNLVATEQNGLVFQSPKSKHGRRSITLPALLVEELRQHKIKQLETRLMLGLGKDENALVVANADGSMIKPKNLTNRFASVIRNWGGQRITLHGLRHTHITSLLSKNVHIKAVSERAGHSTVVITLERYAHVIPSLQEDAASIMESTLRSSLEL